MNLKIFAFIYFMVAAVFVAEVREVTGLQKKINKLNKGVVGLKDKIQKITKGFIKLNENTVKVVNEMENSIALLNERLEFLNGIFNAITALNVKLEDFLKKFPDLNQCANGSHDCDINADCKISGGSFKCTCKSGFLGNGTFCKDIDECVDGSNNCHSDAVCTNTVGSFTCACSPGFTGNGTSCKDIDECTDGNDNCHSNAVCTNTIGSFRCACKPGYFGNGTFCKAALTQSFDTAGHSGRTGSIQSYVIPATGTYKIVAAGARGGNHTTNYGSYPGSFYGGKGAVMKGKFKLMKGTTLQIVVGQKGGNSVEVKGGRSTTQTAASLGLSIEDNAGTGGGGGSFVYTSLNVLLLAAGGGGGATAGWNGVDGQSGKNGTASVGRLSRQRGTGGRDGQPGQCCNTGSYHGGVGAGWKGRGAGDRASVSHGERGGSRIQGWIGGKAGTMNSGNNGGPAPGAVGGFGGGGGGSEDNGASGAGGGYSGGGSGTHSNQAGGGGGSYCDGTNCSGITGGNPNNDGYAIIEQIA